MNLQEFLQQDHIKQMSRQDARDAARQYMEISGRLVEATSVNSLLSELDVTADIKQLSEDPNHITRHKMTSVYTGLLGGHPFNVIVGTFAGDKAIAQLNWLIDEGLNDKPDLAQKLAIAQGYLMQMANIPSYPFSNVTLHDVLLGYDECPVVDVSVQGGYILITTTGDCELHQARIHATNPRTGQPQVLGRVSISAAGVYEFKVPAHYLQHTDFKIDNTYGAIE